MKRKKKYSPIGIDKDGVRIAPDAAKLKQSSRGMYETPQMRKPLPYKRPGSKTDS